MTPRPTWRTRPRGRCSSSGPRPFIRASSSTHPPPPAVAEVCRRLDGLPLAIELAAAWARLLTAAQIAERLEETLSLPAGAHGREERHQTMRAALAWSYDLLTDAEQELFRRLAVFRSGFILEAAAAVAPGVSDDILSVLGGLVDKSLVTVVDGPGGQRRFRLLEPVRQFAAELLQASGERDDAASRHRDHLLSRLATHASVRPWLGGVRAIGRRGGQSASGRRVLDGRLGARGGHRPDSGLRDVVGAPGTGRRVTGPAGGGAGGRRCGPDAPRPSGHRPASQASTWSTYLGRLDDAAAFVDRLAELRDQHPENLVVQAAWSWPAALPNWFRAGGDRLQGNQLMRQAQDAAEASGPHHRCGLCRREHRMRCTSTGTPQTTPTSAVPSGTARGWPRAQVI